MNDNIVLMSINELLDKQFFIPHYQRGYRWTGQQVEQLLDDIDKFFPREILGNSNEKTFYCLQPVVVKIMDNSTKAENNLEGVWYEVIDGQQRLTTIFLIIQYNNELWTGRQKKNQFKLNYQTRDNCVQFLQDLKINADLQTVTINSDNIDFFHITKAYQKIRNWESNYKTKNSIDFDPADFQSKFFTNSKIIWYQVATETKSQALFERLNLGKIPLTNAELTKALFLSSESFKELCEEERKIKQFEIARLWDEIEHKLNEQDLKFWSFITNKKRDDFDTKIELILDLISGKPVDEKDNNFTFNNFSEKQRIGNLSQVWEEIEQFYFTLLDWYKDKNLYHKIGYLIAAKPISTYKGVALGQLVKDSMTKTKIDFKTQLNDLIKGSVAIELSELRYKDHPNQIFNVLLLFNVETNRTSDAISEFYPFKQHKGTFWSLEHIHARNSENFDKNKKEPWLKWLELHRPLVLELHEISKEEIEKTIIQEIIDLIDKYKNPQITWERFNDLFQKVNNIFTLDTESLDRECEGIANLALLSQPDNAALNNSVFEIKRREIIRLDKNGSFIPVCTRRAFMKYYNEDRVDAQFFYWSETDRNNYVASLSLKLSEYLPVNHIEDNEDE